jgi:hypothetical protein
MSSQNSLSGRVFARLKQGANPAVIERLFPPASLLFASAIPSDDGREFVTYYVTNSLQGHGGRARNFRAAATYFRGAPAPTHAATTARS